MNSRGTEAQNYVWKGAIPLQIHLHESEITTLPAPPPALILGPRIGYLPLLVPLIKPHFNSTLPPGIDTVWFDYKGLPLKWYIQTGVLFDLLCTEPERPWNLTVHFRGYPSELLSPCEGEDSVKWSFINSLKEAAYIINGNCKNVMNMSQPDQLELWQCVIKGDMEGYIRVASRLKLGTFAEDSGGRTHETDIIGQNRTGRIPVRLYLRNVSKDVDLEDEPAADSWDKIYYINRPVEFRKEEGKYLSLRGALEHILPDLFGNEPEISDRTLGTESEGKSGSGEPDSNLEGSESLSSARDGGVEDNSESCSTERSEVKLIRIQGIEADLDIPFSWVVNNLMSSMGNTNIPSTEPTVANASAEAT